MRELRELNCAIGANIRGLKVGPPNGTWPPFFKSPGRGSAAAGALTQRPDGLRGVRLACKKIQGSSGPGHVGFDPGDETDREGGLEPLLGLVGESALVVPGHACSLGVVQGYELDDCMMADGSEEIGQHRERDMIPDGQAVE